MELLGVYGASGFGREVMPLARRQYPGIKCVFIDDNPASRIINGHDVLTLDEFISRKEENKYVSIAIADSKARCILSSNCADYGLKEINIFADNVKLLDDVVIGDGCIICHYAMITSNVKIGRNFHANIYSYVAHDCIVGDYVTFAPSVQCNGNVIIEDHAYIGTAAVIRQGAPGSPIVIGRGAVVGMGAVVTKSVPPGVTVVGNPARPLVKG